MRFTLVRNSVLFHYHYCRCLSNSVVKWLAWSTIEVNSICTQVWLPVEVPSILPWLIVVVYQKRSKFSVDSPKNWVFSHQYDYHSCLVAKKIPSSSILLKFLVWTLAEGSIRCTLFDCDYDCDCGCPPEDRHGVILPLFLTDFAHILLINCNNHYWIKQNSY